MRRCVVYNHEQHRPRKLTANISFEFFNLRSIGFNDGGTPDDPSDDTINDPATFDNLRSQETGQGTPSDTSDDTFAQLRAQLPLAGDDDWTLAEIDTYIEPFLEKDTSDIQLTATKGQEIVKLESKVRLLQSKQIGMLALQTSFHRTGMLSMM